MDKEGAMRVLKNNLARFDEADIKQAFKKWDKVVQYRFTDTGEIRCLKITHGDAELVEGPVKEYPELEYAMTTDTCVAMAAGEISGMAAHKQGLVKVQGAIRDMLKWKKITTITLED